MAKRKFSNTQLAVFAIVLVVGGTYFAPQIMQLGEDVYTFVFPGDDGGGTGYDPTMDFASHSFILYTNGNSTVVESAAVYAWYDWDGNGLVKLGEFTGISGGVLGGGEIETLSSAATTGVVTTSVEYPIGEFVSYQVHKSGYEVMTFERVRSSIPNAHDGSALAVTNCHLIASADTTASVLAGTTLMVSGTTDYNYTLSGTQPMCTLRLTPAVTDSGIEGKGYTHWGTGKVYGDSFIGMAMLTADANVLGADPADWDEIVNDGTYTLFKKFFVNLPEFFYDADDTGLGIYEFKFQLGYGDGITGDGDIYQIGVWSDVLATSLGVHGNWGSADGTLEDNLDFTA